MTLTSNPLRNPVPLWVAIVLSMAGGLLLRTAFPAPGIWPFAFLGLGLILFALRGRGFWTGFLIGAVGGGALWGSLIFWLTLYLGPIPWLALCALMTIWVALSCGLIALVYRWADQSAPVRPSTWIHFGAVPVTVAALWSARETLAASWPYGGFSWARLAYAQSESPFSHAASWIGVAGLSFVVALVAASAVAIVTSPRRGAMVAWGIGVLGLCVLPVFPNTVTGTSRILAVQGNSNAGLFAVHNPGDILSEHVSATMMAKDEPSAKNLDIIVWPENASDIDPLRSPGAAKVLDAVSETFSAPIVTGTITNPGGETYFNSSLVWSPGVGVTGQYDKMRPVPFAEYMPNRDFFHALVPDLVNLVSRDYSFGTRPNVIDVGGVKAGISICFDITDNTLTSHMIRDGAEVILAQTNNADFGTTDENLQQLAIARLAAIESGRALVNDSTVGTTAIIRADGSTLSILEPYQPGYIVADVPLSDTVTPAIAFGRIIELALCAIGIAGFVALGLGAVKLGRRRRPTK